MPLKSHQEATIIAARRSALGRIGGLHRTRRIEELAAPILAAALADAGIGGDAIEHLIIGNTSAGGNPARIIALAAGLPDTVPALSIDRQCASGLDAILAGLRIVSAGEADIVVAGGAEALSTAPWRVAKPRTLQQSPRFLPIDGREDSEAGEPSYVASAEAIAEQFQITRLAQDTYAAQAYARAEAATMAGKFVGEITPVRTNAIEARDESTTTPITAGELADMPTYRDDGGTVTAGNAALMHDGAAFVVIVSERVRQRLGLPGLRLIASTAVGVPPNAEATSPIEAVKRLKSRLNGASAHALDLVELAETSAAQAIAFRASLGVDNAVLNPDGGDVGRGHPAGASSAIVVTRLFTRLIRHRESRSVRHGLAVSGALGGQGIAALFEIA